jgi:hypothetical protein
LVVLLLGLVGLNYMGVNYLFANLRPGPYRSLFMALVLVRVTVWLGLAALGVWWYEGAVRGGQVVRGGAGRITGIPSTNRAFIRPIVLAP